jgi:two-component system cell cycle sensor histidine kinase/response regulator CckA
MPQVVLAEDETQLRGLIGEALTQRGITVMEAEDGAQALGMIRDNPGVALLLSDVRMPHMNGYELVEASLQVHPELKVLMMTAYAADHPPPALLRAREIRTLIKPFDPDRMVDIVCDMLGRP